VPRLTLHPIVSSFCLLASALLSGAAHSQPGAAGIAQAGHPYVRIEQTIPGTGTPWELQLVQTTDEIYVPIGVRKPAGNGPFPMILIGSGQGRDGMLKIEQAMAQYETLMTRLVERGYVAAFVSYRNEVPELYNEIASAGVLEDTVSGGNRILRAVPALDSDDHLAIVAHARSLPYTNPEAIGAIGSSHSGEIIMKTATAHGGLAAAVPSEAAVLEYLAIDASKAPRDATGSELQLQDKELARRLADRERAMQRIRQVDIPLLVVGRDHDHLQGAFALLYEWLAEAGKDASWASFNHPEHGYSLLESYGDARGPDAIQEQVFERYMGFFDEHLKRH
jgi:dienelactone hydrolase